MYKPVITRTAPAAAKEEDRIRVFLHGCKAELSVGIYQHEQNHTQPVLVDIEMEAALPHHYQDLAENKLDRVIDYEPIYDYICKDLPKLGHIPLLETVAEQIIAFCFRDVRVQKVCVRLEKTAVFKSASGAGIEISRTRRD